MEQSRGTMVRKEKEGGARLQKKPKKRGRGGLIALGVAAGLAVAGYGALCAYAQNTPALWRGTEVLGQDLGGQTAEEAAAQVERALPGLSIDLYLYDRSAGEQAERGETPDGSVPLTALHADIDIPALVEGADRESREGSFLTAGFRYLTHSGTRYGGESSDIRFDGEALKALAGETAFSLSQPVQNTEYALADNTLQITLAKDGRTVSPEDLQAGLEDAGRWNADLSLDVPYSVAQGQTVTAQAIHDEIYGEMKNAGYDAETDSIIPEVVGADFDVSAAQAAMDGGEPGETVSVPARLQQPAVTAEALKAVLFRDVLGEARTHVGGTAARRSNVALAASAFNGVVLNTGDVFSYNGTVGQRTTAKGYKPAPAYVQGETVDEIGGGVCQPSSTLYLACLRANLEITERYAHRYAPSYIEWGMDATVSWGGPDYKFTNNTDYPLKLVTVYEGGYLTVRLLGTNVDGTYARMTHEEVGSTAFQVIYEDDPTLPAGTEKVKTTPYTGHRVKSYRHVYDASGKLLSSTLEATSDYKSRNKVILRGPAAEVPASGAETGTPSQGSGAVVTPGEPITGPGTTTPSTPQQPENPTPSTPQQPENPTPSTPQEPAAPETPVDPFPPIAEDPGSETPVIVIPSGAE